MFTNISACLPKWVVSLRVNGFVGHKASKNLLIESKIEFKGKIFYAKDNLSSKQQSVLDGSRRHIVMMSE